MAGHCLPRDWPAGLWWRGAPSAKTLRVHTRNGCVPSPWFTPSAGVRHDHVDELFVAITFNLDFPRHCGDVDDARLPRSALRSTVLGSLMLAVLVWARYFDLFESLRLARHHLRDSRRRAAGRGAVLSQERRAETLGAGGAMRFRLAVAASSAGPRTRLHGWRTRNCAAHRPPDPAAHGPHRPVGPDARRICAAAAADISSVPKALWQDGLPASWPSIPPITAISTTAG